MRKSLLLLSLFMLFGFYANAQSREVKGTVISGEDDLPIPGVNIQIKGTTKGVVTDFDGKYSIIVPDNDAVVLIFRFIGLETQEMSVGNRSILDVTLGTDLTTLGEVVVTGVAAATPIKKLPFTVATVGEDIIQQVPAANAGSALAGKLPGVRVRPSNAPGGGPAIQLRGSTSIFGSSAPLIVLDGVLIEGTLADINMQDVERFEVLKGASAATLYGSRAANGVIAITTKRGKDLKVGTTQVMVRNEVAFENAYLSRSPQKALHHSFDLNADGSIRVDGTGQGIPSIPNISDKAFPVYRNHVEDFFTGTTVLTNYARIQSRGANSNTMVSFEHQKASGGIDLHNGNRRYNLRFNNDQKLGTRFTLSNSAIFIRTQNDDRSRYIRTLIMMDPSADLNALNENGTPYRYNVNKFAPTSEFNPFYQLSNNQATSVRQRIIANSTLKVELTESLFFETAFGVDAFDNNSRSFQDIGYLANQGEPGRGSLGRGYSNRLAITTSARLAYVKRIGDLNLRSNLFYQYEDNNGESFSVSGRNLGVQGGFDFFGNVTLSPEDGLPFLSAGASNTQQVRADNFSFSVGGDYQERYLFDFVVRRDGVSLFGSEERWQTFFRGSLGYRISEAIKINGIDELKIGASLGTAGGRPGFTDRFERANINNGVISRPTVLANPFLAPNITTEFEGILSMEFLKKWTFNASYSFQENADQIMSVPISAVTGRTSQVQNAGTLETSTLEISLGYKAVQTSTYGLDFILNFDRTRQEITSFNRPDLPVNGGLGLFTRGGGIFTQLYGTKLVRSFSDLTIREDGIVANLPGGLTLEDFEINREGYVIRKGTENTIDERAILVTDENGAFTQTNIIGNGQPDFFTSLITNFRYKKLNVYMLWEYQQGGNIYNQGAQWLARDQLHPMYDQSAFAPDERKHTSYFLSIYNVNRYTDAWVEDASHLRLRELALNYDFNKADMAKLGMGAVFQSAKVSFVARNLLLISGYSGFDPATGSFVLPVDNFNLPLVRNYGASITLTF